MPSTYSTIRLTTTNHTAQISLNRPKYLNAYNIQMRDEFSEALHLIKQDQEIRCLIIAGEGSAFCAGADLTEFGSAPSQAVARYVRWQRDVWGEMVSLPKPIIAAVHGYCIGSGLEIALLSDIRIAGKSTVFAMPETHLGMIPAAGGTQTLPRVTGIPTALDILLTGDRFDSNNALRSRIVSRIVEDDQLLNHAYSLADKVSTIRPDKLAALKEIMHSNSSNCQTESLSLEKRSYLIDI